MPKNQNAAIVLTASMAALDSMPVCAGMTTQLDARSHRDTVAMTKRIAGLEYPQGCRWAQPPEIRCQRRADYCIFRS